LIKREELIPISQLITFYLVVVYLESREVYLQNIQLSHDGILADIRAGSNCNHLDLLHDTTNIALL
jgi:hypothetical protein